MLIARLQPILRPGMTTHNRFSDRPLNVWVIDAGYQVVSVEIMAMVPKLWRY